MKYLLTPCKIREDRFVTQKGAEAVSFLWPELVARFAPRVTPEKPEGLKVLKLLTVGAFVGIKHDGSNFVFANPDRSNSIAILIKRDYAFTSKIKEVWRVDSIEGTTSQITE